MLLTKKIKKYKQNLFSLHREFSLDIPKFITEK